MTRMRKVTGQQVGFLSGRPQPPQPPSSFGPPSPFVSGPGPLPPGNPQTPPQSGLGGILQGLMGGTGQVDMASVLANTQKVIGVINEIGPIVQKLNPMLQMLKGLNVSELLSENDDTLTEIADDEGHSKPKKRKRYKRKTTKYRKRTKRRR